jgi:hypothetical protein
LAVQYHPWQTDLVELVELAVYHLNKNTAFDNRIAFLLFDISIESVFKTFLTLPEEITKAKIKYQQRKDAVDGNFHNLARAIKEAASNVTETEIAHIQYFHDQRNKLYHQGTGITIPQQSAFDYGQLLITMLNKLLLVDLSGIIVNNSEMKAEIQRTLSKWQTFFDSFQDVVYQVIENIEPKLLYPSSQRQLRSISTINTGSYLSQEKNYRSFIKENIKNEQTKSWLLTLIESESISLSSRNLTTMMEWTKDPVYLCLLIIGYSLSIDDDFDTTFLSPSEEIGDVENIVGHIIGIYSSVKWRLERLNDFMPPNSSLTVFNGIIHIGNEECELLQVKGSILMEWLIKNK